MTKVVNLLGGPGLGKSTMAAELYVKMKKSGLNVEMVREVAKDYVYDGRKIGPFEQLSILGEQIKKESSLFGKVDYIITDSPVLLGAFYLEYNHNQDFMNETVISYYQFAEEKGMKFYNYVLPRREEYNPEGRFESFEEAIVVDEKIYEYLEINKYGHYLFQGNDYDKILNNILESLK